MRPARGLTVLVALMAVVAIVATACDSSSDAVDRPDPTTTTDAPSTASSSTTTSTVPVWTKPTPAVPVTGAYFGTWRGPGPGRGEDPQAEIAVAEQQIGRRYAIDHRYYDWGSPVPGDYERWTASQGRIPMVSICACHFDSGATVPWSTIASGSEDGYITAIADGFKTLGPSFFVFDGEPENKVQDHGSAEDYKAAWRRIHQIFRARGADNVAFMWAMTGYAFQAESGQLGLAVSLYPGDDVTDWIAVDPYNFNHDGAWHSLSTEMGPWYRWARSQHPDKPLAFAEWGSKEDPNTPGRKAAWFTEARRDLRTKYRAVKAVVYFDEEKHERGTVNDWRIDTSDTALAAFGEVARSKWFNPTVRSRK